MSETHIFLNAARCADRSELPQVQICTTEAADARVDDVMVMPLRSQAF